MRELNGGQARPRPSGVAAFEYFGILAIAPHHRRRGNGTRTAILIDDDDGIYGWCNLKMARNC
ncbi:hypothetical protein ACNJHR_21250, partial [Mycobacterium tuberculosis]